MGVIRGFGANIKATFDFVQVSLLKHSKVSRNDHFKHEVFVFSPSSNLRWISDPTIATENYPSSPRGTPENRPQL